MSLRNSRDLRTIAECIDALLAGDLPHLVTCSTKTEGGADGGG